MRPKTDLRKLKLSDLLRRRKMTLRQFIDELNITTYDSLLSKCHQLGVISPQLEEFDALRVIVSSNPQEGIVVIDTMEIVEKEDNVEVQPEQSKKLKRKKRSIEDDDSPE